MSISINKEYKAKTCSYSTNVRKLEDVKYIVIHYTGNEGDTAINNCKYFAQSNNRAAGAHFFIDQAGNICQSIDPKYTAWAVGGCYSTSNGAGNYYKICTNANSVSIELCDLADGQPSWKMTAATRKLVLYIRKMCPNAKTIIRHWDVNGKDCPTTMVGKNNEEWKTFKQFINKGYVEKKTVEKKVKCRTSAKIVPTNKVGVTLPVGTVVKCKRQSADGKFTQIVVPAACKAKGATSVWVYTKYLK